MKTIPMLILTALALSGCGLTPAGDAMRAAVRDRGASIADEGVVNAEWFLCHAATVGSIKRAYGTSAERAGLYKGFCLSGGGQAHDVIGPAE